MSKPIWMPLYVGDYLQDTSRLTTVQHGAYLLLLMDYWTNGLLPDDDAVLATVARLPLRDWKKHRPALERYFDIRDGFWHQCRADFERAKTEAFADKQRANGAKGGRPKKPDGSEEEPTGKANENPTQNPNETQPKTQTKPKRNPTANPNETISQSQSQIKTVNFNEASECKPTLFARAQNPKPPETQTQAEPKPPPQAASGTVAGAICRRLIDAGITGVNPSHPRLLALLAAGLGADEICAVASEPRACGKGMAWVLATAEGRRRDCANMKPLPARSGHTQTHHEHEPEARDVVTAI